LLFDFIKPGSRPLLLAGAGLGIALLIGCSIAIISDFPERPLPTKHSQDSNLRILLGVGNNFEKRESVGLYQTGHSFNVCIENAHTAQFLSNCKLSLNIANEKGVGRQDYWLEGPFTLNPTERKFRSIVSYREPATARKHAGDFIQLHIPIGSGYGAGYGWPWRLPVGGYTFSLRATALEAGPAEIVCKVWVDDNSELHFEKA
jgi:hypothetical protein